MPVDPELGQVSIEYFHALDTRKGRLEKDRYEGVP